MKKAVLPLTGYLIFTLIHKYCKNNWDNNDNIYIIYTSALKVLKSNGVFVTNSDFLILISLEFNVVDLLRYYKQ